MQPWWKKLFGTTQYQKTYIDVTTTNRTEREVFFIEKKVISRHGGKILDLACGQGRHTIALLKDGYPVVGFDYSQHLLAFAKKTADKEGVRATFIRGDMRKLPFYKKFDIVLSMFTSFGYFEDESDHALTLQNINQSLKKGGLFFLDLQNISYITERLRKKAKQARVNRILSNGLTISTRTSFNKKTRRWSMDCRWLEEKREKKYITSVRCFTQQEITDLLHKTGFKVLRFWGDFDATAYSPSSPRMLILSKKCNEPLSSTTS